MNNKIKNKTLRPVQQIQGKQAQGERGFTLIELIVSITIIAVMTVVAAVSFTGVGKKSRDGRRIADLQKIALALEALKQQSVGSTYPATANIISALTPTYLTTFPIGPKKETYTYTRESSYVYRICAAVEDIGSTTSDVTSCPALPSGYVGYFKIKN